MLHAIPFDGEENTLFFRAGKGFYGASVHVPAAVLDLKKDGDPVFFCDDVDFASFGCDVVGFYDFVVVLL